MATKDTSSFHQEPSDLLPDIKGPIPGSKAKAELKLDEKYISPSYTRNYPLVVDRALGSTVWDVDGNRFLDFNAGIAVCSTGHCHPKIVEAIQKQSARLIHMSGTDFYYPQQVEVAKALTEIIPIKESKRIFLSNSGAEAVECAMKLARFHTGRPHFISFYGSFHGRTLGAMSLSNSKTIHRRKMGPVTPEATAVPYAYCYRCPVNRCYPGCSLECLDQLEHVVFSKRIAPDEVAAIFVEPVQGEGGYVPAPREFLARLRDLCNQHGILLVFDEIQSGMGRTGKYFASEHSGVVADIYCVAKGIASGLPLGATVASSRVMTWDSGSHATTFGGNPVSCAASVKTIELLKDGLLDHCREMGERLLSHLRPLVQTSPIVGDVRGFGLMVGMEIVSDKAKKTQAHDLRNEIVMECFRKGLLILGCGPNTLRFCPPLVVTPSQIDWACETVAKVIRGHESKA